MWKWFLLVLLKLTYETQPTIMQKKMPEWLWKMKQILRKMRQNISSLSLWIVFFLIRTESQTNMLAHFTQWNSNSKKINTCFCVIHTLLSLSAKQKTVDRIAGEKFQGMYFMINKRADTQMVAHNWQITAHCLFIFISKILSFVAHETV